MIVDGSISQWRVASSHQLEYCGITSISALRITGMTIQDYPNIAISIDDRVISYSYLGRGFVLRGFQ